MKKKLLLLLPLLLGSLISCSPKQSKDPVTFKIDFALSPETNTSSANFEENFLYNFKYNNEQYVSRLTYEGYSQVNHVDQFINGETVREKALMLGNASGKGVLNFTFKRKLSTVSLLMRAHVKVYNGGISADTNSKINVNEENFRFPTPTIDNLQKITKTYNINSKEFTLSTDDVEKGRVWIFEATLTFEG